MLETGALRSSILEPRTLAPLVGTSGPVAEQCFDQSRYCEPGDAVHLRACYLRCGNREQGE